MPVKFWQMSVRFWGFLSYLITTVMGLFYKLFFSQFGLWTIFVFSLKRETTLERLTNRYSTYIRTVSSQLFFSFDTFISFLASLGRNWLYSACCSDPNAWPMYNSLNYRTVASRSTCYCSENQNFCFLKSRILTCRNFFLNKTFLLLKLESWNFQHLIDFGFRESSANSDNFYFLTPHVT